MKGRFTVGRPIIVSDHKNRGLRTQIPEEDQEDSNKRVETEKVSEKNVRRLLSDMREASGASKTEPERTDKSGSISLVRGEVEFMFAEEKGDASLSQAVPSRRRNLDSPYQVFINEAADQS